MLWSPHPGYLATPTCTRRVEMRAVVTFFFFSAIATELVFYLLDPLLPYDLQSRIFSLTDRFIDFTVKDIWDAVIFLSFLIVQVLSIRNLMIQIVITRQRSYIFFVTTMLLCPFLISWWIVGYIHPRSVIISFLLFIYTVIAMVSARTTIGRPFIANPTEFKKGN